MPILIKGSGGAVNERTYRYEAYVERGVSFERDGSSIILTFPLKLSGTCKIKTLSIDCMRIGEAETGSAKWRWRFSGAIYSTSSRNNNCGGEWCMVNDSTNKGYNSDDLEIDYTYDGSNLVVTITDENTIALMSSSAIYLNQFSADLFYSEG